MSPSGQPVLQLTGIYKHFGAVQALSDVELDVHAGEVVALVGDNGAGKSTLIKVIAGAGPADAGEIRWQGKPVTISSPGAAQALGIATVYQDLALCDNLDVVANMFLGREQTTFGVLDEIAMEKRSQTLLDTLSINIPNARIPVASLSGGQRQTVAISRALLGDPSVVVLDEPTAALGVEQTAQVLDLVERLRERGHGVVLISHNIQEVASVADRISVLRLGRNNGVFDARSTTQEQIVAAITGASDSAAQRRSQRISGYSDPTDPLGGTTPNGDPR